MLMSSLRIGLRRIPSSTKKREKNHTDSAYSSRTTNLFTSTTQDTKLDLRPLMLNSTSLLTSIDSNLSIFTMVLREEANKIVIWGASQISVQVRSIFLITYQPLLIGLVKLLPQLRIKANAVHVGLFLLLVHLKDWLV